MLIKNSYAKREIKFLQFWQLEDWKFKVYAITHAQRPMPNGDSPLVKASLDIAQQRIRKVEQSEHHGAGFLIIHQGRDANFLLLDWWTDENILHQDLYTSKLSTPLSFVNITSSGLMACVWEMQVQSFERDAWISYVLNAPSLADLDAYFGQQLNGAF